MDHWSARRRAVGIEDLGAPEGRYVITKMLEIVVVHCLNEARVTLRQNCLALYYRLEFP